MADINIIPEMLGVQCVDDIDEPQLAALLHELVARRGEVNRVRVMCKSIKEEAETNPTAKLGNAAMGMRSSVRAIEYALADGALCPIKKEEP